jgi:hypothetical protein
VIEADGLRNILGLDARRPQHTLTSEDVVDGVAVDAELDGELLDPAAGVGRNESGYALGVETLLRLLRRTFGPSRSRRAW